MMDHPQQMATAEGKSVQNKKTYSRKCAGPKGESSYGCFNKAYFLCR